MSAPVDGIRISDDSDGLGHDIEAELLRSLQTMLPQAENRRLVFSLRDAEGGLVGGVVASTSYGWLLVKALWIAEACRGRSLGRSLMQHAEEKARAIGCHAAWLDTSNPAARRFYAKLGYRAFGRLANATGQHPGGHRRWFMQKRL